MLIYGFDFSCSETHLHGQRLMLHENITRLFNNLQTFVQFLVRSCKISLFIESQTKESDDRGESIWRNKSFNVKQLHLAALVSVLSSVSFTLHLLLHLPGFTNAEGEREGEEVRRGPAEKRWHMKRIQEVNRLFPLSLSEDKNTSESRGIKQEKTTKQQRDSSFDSAATKRHKTEIRLKTSQRSLS